MISRLVLIGANSCPRGTGLQPVPRDNAGPATGAVWKSQVSPRRHLVRFTEVKEMPARRDLAFPQSTRDLAIGVPIHGLQTRATSGA